MAQKFGIEIVLIKLRQPLVLKTRISFDGHFVLPKEFGGNFNTQN